MKKAIDMTEGAMRKTCSFSVCRACTRSCCQDAKPPLTDERMRIIKEHLKKQRNLPEMVFNHSDYSFPSVDSNGFCVFYDKGTKKCLIHEVKPETCRAGPVTFDINCRTRKVEWYLKKGALCPLAGKLFETPEEFNEHLKMAKDEIMQLIRKLDSGALRAILTRDEPETFKIGEDTLPPEVLAKLALSDRL